MEQRFVEVASYTLMQAAGMVAGQVINFWKGHIKVKADGSFVTDLDEDVEQLIKKHFREAFPGVPFLGEEGGLDEGRDSRYMILVDPIDGTRSMMAGASTSTSIASLYDREAHQVVAVVIIAHGSLRVWSAIRGQGCWLTLGDTKLQCRVWDGTMDLSTMVMVDRHNAFTRDGRTILTDDSRARLFLQLQKKASIKGFGSNGFHHALVAGGGPMVAGAMTTAVGGPWDCGGVLLVAEAGGAAKGFALSDAGQLTEHDPLDVLKHDNMVVANNPATVDTLATALACSL